MQDDTTRVTKKRVYKDTQEEDAQEDSQEFELQTNKGAESKHDNNECENKQADITRAEIVPAEADNKMNYSKKDNIVKPMRCTEQLTRLYPLLVSASGRPVREVRSQIPHRVWGTVQRYLEYPNGIRISRKGKPLPNHPLTGTMPSDQIAYVPKDERAHLSKTERNEQLLLDYDRLAKEANRRYDKKHAERRAQRREAARIQRTDNENKKEDDDDDDDDQLKIVNKFKKSLKDKIQPKKVEQDVVISDDDTNSEGAIKKRNIKHRNHKTNQVKRKKTEIVSEKEEFNENNAATREDNGKQKQQHFVSDAKLKKQKYDTIVEQEVDSEFEGESDVIESDEDSDPSEEVDPEELESEDDEDEEDEEEDEEEEEEEDEEDEEDNGDDEEEEEEDEEEEEEEDDNDKNKQERDETQEDDDENDDDDVDNENNKRTKGDFDGEEDEEEEDEEDHDDIITGFDEEDIGITEGVDDGCNNGDEIDDIDF